MQHGKNLLGGLEDELLGTLLSGKAQLWHPTQGFHS